MFAPHALFILSLSLTLALEPEPYGSLQDADASVAIDAHLVHNEPQIPSKEAPCGKLFLPLSRAGRAAKTKGTEKNKTKSAGLKSKVSKMLKNAKNSTQLHKNPVAWVKAKRLTEKEIGAEVKAAIQSCFKRVNRAGVMDLFCDRAQKDKKIRKLIEELKKAKQDKKKIEKMADGISPEHYKSLRTAPLYIKCVVDTAGEKLNCTRAVQEYDVVRQIAKDVCGISASQYWIKKKISLKGARELGSILLVQILCLSLHGPVCAMLEAAQFFKEATPLVFKHFVGHRCHEHASG